MPRSPRRLFPLAFALLLAGTASGWAADPEILYASTLTKLLDAPSGAAIGDVNPAAPLKVKSTKDGFVEVEIGGWSPAGGDRYLFKDVGLRISEVVLTEDGLKARASGDSKEDDYGSDWQQAKVTGWIAQKDTAASLDPVWSAAGDLYFSHCTRCHSLRRPGDFTANQWPQALKVMTVRAGFTPAEAALVTVLLQSHAKDQKVDDSFSNAAAKQPATAPATPTALQVTPAMVAKGGELFKSANCFACHGDDAKTPPVPSYPKLAGQNADCVLKQLQDFKSGARGNDPGGAMKQTIGALADGDLEALAAFIASK